MVSLHAFVDDSASDAGDRRLFLAAYIHGAGPWIAFGHDWRAALRADPPIAYLKMVEAQHLRGEFGGWSPEDRDAKVLLLAKVIERHRPWAVHCSVSRAEYARIVAPVAPYPLKQPYFCCFWGIIRTAADYHRHLDHDRPDRTLPIPAVDYLFDEQGGLGTDAALWYSWLKDGQEPEVRALMGDRPLFGDDKAVAPLQAADMLAWHIRRRHERGAGEPLPVLDLLVDHGAYREIDAKTLKRWARGFRRVPGVSGVQHKRDWHKTRLAARAALAANAGPPNTNPLRMRWLAFRLGARARWNRWRRGR